MDLINVLDPETQEIGSIPSHQLADAQAQGFKPVSPEQAKAYVEKKQYETPGQIAATAVEGAGNAATFGLFPGIETAAGFTTNKDIRARREANPGTHMVGEGVGLLGSALIPEVGAANLLEKAGTFGVEAAGLANATSTMGKIGSAALKGGIENALFQTGDEVAKSITNDPDQAKGGLQTAAANVGLSFLLGGGISGGLGTISPLWKATAGSKIEKVLEALHLKGGEGVQSQATKALDSLASEAGLALAPEVNMGLQTESPYFRQMAETLRQSDTTQSGIEFQQAMKKFENDASNAAVESLGRTEKDVVTPDQFSHFEQGNKMGKTLAKELDEQYGPLAKSFEKVKEKYGDIELPQDRRIYKNSSNPYLTAEEKGARAGAEIIPGTTSQVADKIAKLVQEEGWYASPSSEIMSEVNRVLKELPQQKTLKDLTNYITQLGANTSDFTNPPLRRAGQLMKNVLRDAEAEVVVSKLGQEGPELVAEHQAARDAFKKLASLKDELNDRLHVRGGDSVGSFLKNLKEMDGEKLARRLSGKSDANLLGLLSKELPQTASVLRNYHVDQLLSSAAGKATEGELIKASTLMTQLKKMSPELRDFAISPEAQQKLNAIDQLLERTKSPTHNFSNTGRTVDKLMDILPGSAAGLATAFLSHNPLSGLAVGLLTKYIGKDIPDAVRLGLLKFMGSGQKIDAEGFKTMVDFIQHTIKGENLVSKAAESIFKAGREVLPQSMMPTEKQTDKLSKRLDELQKNPMPLMDIGGKTGHYLPEHAGAMGSTASNAVNYLNSLRPNLVKARPLDPEPKASPQQKQRYQNALKIAEQPMLVLDKLKKGTLSTDDVKDLHNLYPALYDKVAAKLMNNLNTAVSEGHPPPYHTRMSLSLFLGQPLDSTMTPEAIQATQISLSALNPQKSMHGMKPMSASGAKAFKGLGPSFATPSQSREMHRSGRR